MVNLNEFAKEVHANSVSHGWWESPREFPEICALIHSEWSEALEEARAGRPMVYHNCRGGLDQCMCDGHPKIELGDVCTQDAYKGCNFRTDKPEGIAVELIDGCIRILDWLGYKNYSIFPPMLEDGYNLLSVRRIEKVKSYALPELVAYLHYLTSEAYYDNDNDALLSALLIACYWLKQQGVDPEIVIRIKHEYNKGRAYKHGKKF